MSSYKLTYFNVTGRGEPIRYILGYGNIDFEDNRVARESWPALKPSTPLGQVPVLEVDGKTLYQSGAIIRFLARKFDLYGSDEFETFEVDAALETVNDLRQVFSTWFWVTDAAQKEATKAETFTKAAFYLDKLDAAAKKNGGYLVAGKLTVVDLVLASFTDFLNHLAGKDLVAEYPNLTTVVENVVSQPGVKAYLDKRPATIF